MKHSQFFPAIPILFLISYFPAIFAQQPYIGQDLENCDSRDNTTSVLGYTCNGVSRSCQAYLTFRAQPPFNSVSSISTLLSVDPSQLSEINSVSENAIFETNRVLLVPVTCSCSGQNYQANVSYTTTADDTYLIIANDTFQGLSTCQALQVQNTIPATELSPGSRLAVPLRCACPTQSQRNNGVNYLLSYLVTWNQFVEAISSLFSVNTEATLAANGLSDTNFNIYPFTTLLVPLQNPPTSSQVTAPQPPPPPSGATSPPPAPPGNGGSSKTWVYAVVGSVGGLVLVGFIIFFIFFCKKKKKLSEPGVSSQSFESVEKPFKKDGIGEDSEDFLESISSIAQSINIYTFEELKAATKDFSPSCLIKGSVYCGTINGDLAAIKKMNGNVSKEINLLNKINHFNVIRLSGVSFNEGHWYLVYEYASNGPLSDWIHERSEENIMNWKKRLQIALDVAAGLNYLHSYTSPPHVHKDLNSSNVLIDRDFRAKIANFGLARSAEGQEGHFVLTRHIVGTKGYMAPEYLENGVISPKLDVYAFGVLLLEILTGKEVSILYEEVDKHLSEILAPVLDNDPEHGNLGKIMDPSLQGEYPQNLAVVMFRLIDKCLKNEPSDRPNMDDIFQSLSRISTSKGEWAVDIPEPR